MCTLPCMQISFLEYFYWCMQFYFRNIETALIYEGYLFYSREKEIQLWDHFIKALRNGILTIRADDDDTDDDEPPILPCIVSNFLAHMTWIVCEPLHSLYGPVSNFLLAKPSFDVNTIPNFLALFYSTDLKTR